MFGRQKVDLLLIKKFHLVKEFEMFTGRVVHLLYNYGIIKYFEHTSFSQVCCILNISPECTSLQLSPHVDRISLKLRIFVSVFEILPL